MPEVRQQLLLADVAQAGRRACCTPEMQTEKCHLSAPFFAAG